MLLWYKTMWGGGVTVGRVSVAESKVGAGSTGRGPESWRLRPYKLQLLALLCRLHSSAPQVAARWRLKGAALFSVLLLTHKRSLIISH